MAPSCLLRVTVENALEMVGCGSIHADSVVVKGAWDGDLVGAHATTTAMQGADWAVRAESHKWAIQEIQKKEFDVPFFCSDVV